jgi:hypothetical protein
MMLRDGRGGMIDYPKYRDSLTDIVWKGIVPDQNAEQQIQTTKDTVGKPIPESALDEARALRKRMNAAGEAKDD